MPIPVIVSQWMVLFPLALLLYLHQRGESRNIAYWWIAGAYAVSWVADWLADLLPVQIPSLVYPIVQSAIVGAVLLSAPDGRVFVWALCGLALVAIGFLPDLDVLLRTVAWLVISVAAWRAQTIGLTRAALLVTFGAGLIGWYAFLILQSVPSWYGYHLCWAVGVLLYCGAIWSPSNVLRVQATA